MLGSTPDDRDIATALDVNDAGYRAIWHNATIGLYRSAPDGRQVRANPALVRLNGYSSEAEMLAAVRDIAVEWYVDPARRAEFRRLIDEQGRVEDFRSEVYRHRTRERIWVSENAWAIRGPDGRPLYYEGTVADITAQVRMHRALELSEERFRDFAETASDWYWETGPDHRFTYMSERISAFGLDASKRIGLTRFDMAADVADPKLREHLAVLERREPFRDFRYLMRLRDEPPHHLSISGKPVFAPDGAFLGYRGSAREVTKEVEAEEQLQLAWRDAEAASRAKSEFLANMSHELRTPLNAIIGFAEVMKDGLVETAKHADYARHIHESGLHLLALINDVLDMSKIAVGKMEIDPECLDAGEQIRRAAGMFALRAEAGGVGLETDVAEGLPELHADPVRLGQILLNLISNAIKFTPAGGTVTVRCRLADGNRLSIEVADTGIGMSPDDVAIAMEPFSQLARGRNRRHEGTGLGLSITRSLVDLHGGTLTIDSAENRGTVVGVLLPLAGPGVQKP